MNFKIGDRVILIGIGRGGDKSLYPYVGHEFVIESKLDQWEVGPNTITRMMHKLGPAIGNFFIVAEPYTLMKIDPPEDMQTIDDCSELTA